MHKGKHGTPKKKIQEHSCEELVEMYQKQLNQWITQTKRDLKHEEQKQKVTLIRPDNKQLMETYLKYLSEYMCVDRLKYASPSLNNPEQTQKSQSIIKTLMLKSGLLTLSPENGIGVSILPQCVKIFATCELDIQEQIIIRLLSYNNGFLPLNSKMPLSITELTRSPHGDLRYYSNQVNQEIMLIFTVGLEKVPLFSQKKHQIQKFQINLCVTLEAIIDLRKIQGSKKQTLKKVLKKLQEKREWSIRHIYTLEECIVDEHKKRQNVAYFSFTNTNCNGDIVSKISPVVYKPIKSTPIDNLEYMFNYDQQLFYDNQTSSVVSQKKSQEEQYGIEDVSYVKAKQYVNFISDIPNFKFKLTNQQKDVVGENGNLIVIGRSGTGKTLLSMLRLYALEFLKKQSKIYELLSDGKLKRDCVNLHIDKIFEEKNVFLTASSHLIEEIMKQYNDMHYQIQKQHKDSCHLCKEHLHIGTQMEQQDLGVIIQRIEERQNIKGPVSQMKIENFPQFFTVKTMFNIIDSGLQRPFFNIEGKKIDQKNIKMVNIYWTNVYRFYEPYEQQLRICFKERLWKYNKVELEKNVQEDVVIEMMEVDYKLFATKIWPEISKLYFASVKKEKTKLNASVVWAQIFSIIKGSVKAHTSHLKCLSPKMYLEQSKSLFLSYDEKVDIYHLFQEYQKYKINNRCFDLMDVVNHILQEILFGRYNDELINNMFIDEVQDLTPAMIYLLTKVTKKDNFYCGDTAQAISKGVTFKFSQIKSLFSKKYFKYNIMKQSPGQEQHLTVNFRSHNRILMLANAVVSMIKQLFPKTIDVLKEERSDLIGPHNYVVCNGDERLIYNLLLGPLQKYDEQQQEEKQVQMMLENYNNQNQNIVVQQSEYSQSQDSFKSISNDDEDQIQERQYQNQHNNEEIIFQQDKHLEPLDVQQKIEDKPNQIKVKVKKNKKQKMFQLRMKQNELMKRQLSGQQVILVRNQQQKQKLPNFLAKQHKLTCEQVKGLQYDDIVIYNFFSSSPCLDKWNLLDTLDIKQNYVDVHTFESELSRRNKQQGKAEDITELEQETKLQLGYDVQKDKYRIFQIKKNIDYHKIDIKQFHEIANELKLFYTLVTRAKNTVIIFDKKVPRKIVRFLKKMNLTKFLFNNQSVPFEHDKIRSYRKRQSRDRYIDKNQVWRKQGVKMLVRENFDEAIRCFQKAGDIRNVKRVQAMKIVKDSQYQLHNIENLYRNPDKLSREQFRLKKLRLVDKQNEVYQQLNKAAQIFKEINNFNKAGELFLKTESYKSALSCFENTKQYERIAKCHYNLKNYKQALFFYQKCEDTNGILDCYIKMEEWIKAFNMIQNNKKLAIDKLKDDDKFKLNIKICLKNRFESLVEKTNRYSQTYVREKEAVQWRQHIVTKAVKKRNKSIQETVNMLSSQQMINLERIFQPLEKQFRFLIQDQLRIKKQYNEIDERVRALQKEQQELITKESITKKKIQNTCNIINKMGLTTSDISFLEENKNDAIVKKLNSERDQYNKIKKEVEKISQKLRQADQQLEILGQQKWAYQQNQKKNRIKVLQQALKSIAVVKKVYHEMYSNNKKQIDELDNLQSQNLDNQNINKSKDQNKVIRINLNQEKTCKILQQVTDLINLIGDILPIKDHFYFSEFDHRSLRTQIQKYVNQEALRNYKLLEQLNCMQIGYLMCQKFNLNFHIVEQVLGYMLQTSRNFLQKRRIKDVRDAIITKQSAQFIEQKINQYSTVLDRLGRSTYENTIIKKITKQRSYQESMALDIAESLVLQGYYENCILLCQPQQRFYLYYMFLDYDNILKQSRKMINSKGTIRQNSQYSYYFFPVDSHIRHQQQYKHIINLFSMQRIFFDHDQCTENPILSKLYNIDDFELKDSEIIQCKKKADKLLQKYFANSVNLKSQLNHLKEAKQYENKQSNQIIASLKASKKQLNDQTYDIYSNIRMYQKQLYDVKQAKKKVVKNYRSQDEIKKLLVIRKNQKKIAQKKYQQSEKQLSQFLKTKELEKQSVNSYQIKLEKIKQEYIANKKKLEDAARRQYENYKVDQQLKELEKQITFFQSKINWSERQIQKLDRIKKNIDFKIDKQKKKLEQYNQTMKTSQNELMKVIKMWSSKTDMNEKQNFVNRQVIREMKQNCIQKINRKKRQKIKTTIQKASNLKQVPKFEFLHHLIRSEITASNVVKVKKIRSILITSLRKYRDRNVEKLTSYDIGMIIMVFLSFLFNEEFRQACFELCKFLQIQYEKHRQEIQHAHFQIKKHQGISKNASKRMEGCKKKLEQLKEILSNSQNINVKENQKITIQQYNFKQRKIMEDFYYFQQQMNQCFVQIQQNQQFLQSDQIKYLEQKSMSYLTQLLSVFSNIQTVQQQNYKFIQILLGFFQCRIIKNCNILQFLEGQYVIVQADSIVSKKLIEENSNNFGFYFDYKNRTILTSFNDVHRIIINYLGQQHALVRNWMQQNKIYFAKQQVKQSNKKNFIDKSILGYKSIINSQDFLYVHQAYCKNEEQIKQMKRSFESFNQNKLLNKIRNLKKEVLQYYLSNELKEKESFFFIKFQIKEYSSLEKTINSMKVFCPKLLKEVNIKVEQLEKAKKQWINKERFKYESIPNELKQ